MPLNDASQQPHVAIVSTEMESNLGVEPQMKTKKAKAAPALSLSISHEIVAAKGAAEGDVVGKNAAGGLEHGR